MPRRDVGARRTGRPKTKFYVTLMARVPLTLALQAKAYARDHLLSISEVLRTGLVCIIPIQPGTIHSIPIPVEADHEETQRHDTASGKTSSIPIGSPLPATPRFPDTMYLGALCPGKHEFASTGKTLRTKARRVCRSCEARKRRERYALTRGSSSIDSH